MRPILMLGPALLALMATACQASPAASPPSGSQTGGLARPTSPAATLELEPSWQSGRVLQRGQPLTLRGWAPGAAQVVAQLGAAEARAAVEAGAFVLRWPPQPAARGLTLTVHSDQGDTLELGDLAVGDVWLIAGQSNAALSLADTGKVRELLRCPELPLLRCWTIPTLLADEVPTTPAGNWQRVDAASAPGLSALALHFGQWRAAADGIPQGLIVAAQADSPIEAWISRSALNADPELRPAVEAYQQALEALPSAQAEYQRRLAEFKASQAAARAAGKPIPTRGPQPPLGPDNHKRPWALFTGMIAPLANERLAGVVWYQGESNATRAEAYPALLRALLADWRRTFEQPELPFLVVQLPGLGPLETDPIRTNWARLREAQRRVVAGDPHAGLAITIDLGDAESMHPVHKRGVAQRLAELVEPLARGAGPASSGPVPQAFLPQVGGGIEVRFSGVEGQLVSEGPLVGFELQDPAGRWWPATAQLRPQSVAVASPGFQAQALRYAWRDQPATPLRDSRGRLASPFSSDPQALLP